jgi:butyrate kinase
VNDVVLMAVVDAGEDLLEKNSSVSFTELASFADFIEQFAAFADFSHEVIASLVFEKLVHLHDVGVVLKEGLLSL